jgi:hypothetical protein
MRKTCALILVLALVLATTGLANAATSDQKQAAIDAGLAYLYNTRVVSGSNVYWNYGGYETASTAAALLAFTEQYYKPAGWNGHPEYASVVAGATNYLLSTAQSLAFPTPNWWGFTNSTMSGIQWNIGGEETYQSGLAILPLARLVSNPYNPGSPYLSPNTVISSSNPVVNGLTYAQVVQKGIDAFTWFQTAPPNTSGFPIQNPDRYGGWRYYSYPTFSQPADSDMSTTQWPVVDYLFAAQVPGVVVPNSHVTNGVQAFVTACQNGVFSTGTNVGGVDYQPNYNIIDHTHIGGLLMAQKFAGAGAGNLATAIAWLNAHWNETPPGYSSPWTGNFGQPYAMWAVYKGLESLYGTTGAIPEITNFRYDPNTTPIDANATYNWWEDYCQFLVTSQGGDGSWPGYSGWYGPLEAAWYINILNATQTGPIVPIPGAVGLFGTGLVSLLGAGWWRRRKQL